MLPDRVVDPDWLPEVEPELDEERDRVLVCEPDLGDDERELVVQTLEAGWVSGRTPIVETLETEFAEAIGVEYAVTCNSGGSALELLLRAAGVGPGDEVVVPTYTMIATAGAVSLAGATPVFADCDPLSLNIDVASVERAISQSTKAVICVHLYGLPCDVTELVDVCRTYGVSLFEDAAEAHGGRYRGVAAGALGDGAVFGFYGNKTMTTGEGGMVVTDDAALANRVRSLRDYCFMPGRHFWHTEIGHSYRMPALAAAVGLAQLRRLGELVALRQAVAREYDRLLEGSTRVLAKASDAPVEGKESSWWFYWVRLADRAQVRLRMASEGIETRPGFVPMHLQPCYRHGLWPTRTAPGHCPNAEEVASEVTLLPTHPRLSPSAQARVVASLETPNAEEHSGPRLR